MDIGTVLSRAWQIIMRHKVLWIFGILAGCTSANLGSSNVRYSFEQEELPFDFRQPDFQFNGGPEFVILGLIILVVVLVLLVAAVFLGTVGRIGLIRGAARADAGEVAGDLGTGAALGERRLVFSELFNESLPYFWRVFGLNLLIWFAAPLLLALVFVLLAVSIVGIACLIPLVCLLAPIAWAVGILVQMAYHEIVLEDAGVFDAIGRGWQVFRLNLGALLLVGLIVAGISLVAGFIIGLPLILVAVPALAGVAFGEQSFVAGSVLVTLLCLLAYIPVALFLNGILQSYLQSVWTLTYRRLSGRQVTAGAPTAG